MLSGFLIPSVVKGLEVFLIFITVFLSYWPSYSLRHVRSETTFMPGKNSPRYILSLEATEQLTLLPKASNPVETTAAGQGQQVVFATASL